MTPSASVQRKNSYGRGDRGMTLIEILIVVAIITVGAGGVALSYRQVQRTAARSAAGKLAAAIRYVYDQAIVTGKYYRLTIDLDRSAYYVERTDERFYLVAGKEKSPGDGKAFDADAEQKKLDEEEANEKDRLAGIAQQLRPPPMKKRAHFQAFRDATLPKVEMKGAWIRDLVTPRQTEPYREGKAYLYFFPDGHTERAVIHIVAGRHPSEDEDRSGEGSDIYTLIIHPLTGRVEMKNGDLEVPRDFDSQSDEGDAEGTP